MTEDEFNRLPLRQRLALRQAGEAPDQQKPEQPEPPPARDGMTYEEFMALPIRVRVALRQAERAP